MKTKLNTRAQALNEQIPAAHSNSGYLHRSILRKEVEQLEWLINQAENKEAQLVSDMEIITSANITEEVFESLGGRVKQMTAKYGSVIGAPHYDEVMVAEIELMQLEVAADIQMLQKSLTAAKEAFKQLTGDEFTPYQRRPKDTRSNAEKLKALEAQKAKLKKLVA